MTKQDHINYWKKSSDDDWQTVMSLIETKRFAHALFFAHLVLEKLCKAHWVKDNVENSPPRTHNLVKLVLGSYLKLVDEQIDFLREFNDFQLEGRYPDYQFEIHKRCTADFTNSILEKVKKIKGCLHETL